MVLVVPLGAWMAKVFTGKPNFLSPVIDLIEQKFLGHLRDKLHRRDGLETVCHCPYGLYRAVYPVRLFPAASSRTCSRSIQPVLVP